MSTLNVQLLYRRSKRFPLIIHYLLPDLAPGLTLNGSSYPYLDQFFMVPKRFEPSKFDCTINLAAVVSFVHFQHVNQVLFLMPSNYFNKFWFP